MTTTAATSMISKNRTTTTSLVPRTGQEILMSTSWMPAPFGSTIASPVPPGDTPPRGRGDHLGGELAGGVQQSHERTTHGLTGAIHHAAGDDCFLLQVDAGRQSLSLLWRRAHNQLPNSIGAPTREPYSVQLPS